MKILDIILVLLLGYNVVFGAKPLAIDSLAQGSAISIGGPLNGCKDSLVLFSNTSTTTAGWAWQWTLVKGSDTVRLSTTSLAYAFYAEGSYKVFLHGDSATYFGDDSIIIDIANCRNVWPGDANMDGLVDVDDVFILGFNWGDTGPVRPNSSVVWIEQPATDWGSWFNGINNKHADTDGNGVINVDDTLAIAENFGYAVNKYGGIMHNAPLFLQPVNSNWYCGDVVSYNIVLGILNNDADNVYALSFYLDLDPIIFDTSVAHIDLSNSWLGNAGTDVFSFRKIIDTRLYIAIVSTTRQNLIGNGRIGGLHLQTMASLPPGLSQDYYLAVPSGIKGKMANGTEHTFSSQISEIYINDTLTGTNNRTEVGSVKLYPNPVGEVLNISFPVEKQWQILLTDMAGNKIMNEMAKFRDYSLNLKNLSSGLYLLYLNNEESAIVKKVMVE